MGYTFYNTQSFSHSEIYRMETKSSIQVLDRVVNLLQAISRESGPVNLKFLAAHTGLHPSTAFRILAALQTHGWVERESAGGYRVGRELRRLAGHAAPAPELREAARPIMDRLRDQVGESVNLTVREGDEVVYIERSVPNRMMRIEQVIGSRAPLHVTAVGKLMLAELGETSCRDYAQRTGLRRLTDNTLTDITALERAVADSAKNGYAFDNEEAESGVGCIATLVRGKHGQAVAGLSISAPIERRKSEWVPLLLIAADQLARHLF